MAPRGREGEWEGRKEKDRQTLKMSAPETDGDEKGTLMVVKVYWLRVVYSINETQI